MSNVLHIVKVTGKSKKDLIAALHGAIRELDGETIATNIQSSFSGPVSQENTQDDDDMVDVPSPYAGAAPSLTVVDNEVDSEGIPWDARIHSNGKTKIANGTWKKKKGADENLVYQVKNELRNRVASQAPVQPIQPTAPVAPTVLNVPVAPFAPAAPVVVPQAPVLPQMNQNGHTFATFKSNFPHIIATHVQLGKIDQNYINGLKTYFGIGEIWQANDTQINEVFDQFVQYGFVQRVG